jgi:calmodulin
MKRRAMMDPNAARNIDVTPADLTELRQSFDACDSNGDGWITSQEFSSLLQSLDQELSEDECLLAFELTDADGDGSISFEEFMGWWTE